MLCNMCPRKCNADRSRAVGVCGCSDEITVSRTVRHYWEEPCISGKNGSGAVFFSGCSLKCIYCQNFEISRGSCGKILSKEEFQRLVLNISHSGVHNVNLVTPTHFTRQIVSALSEIKSELSVPVVWNSSGYETEESISSLNGLVDVFLCDLKYHSDTLSREYSSAPDYFDVSIKALKEMLKLSPHPVFDENGILKSGVIVRHLVLPGGKSDSINILESLAEFRDSIILSLMCQYTPTPNTSSHKYLSRRTTSLEYGKVLECADKLGFHGYTQDKASARSEYTPDFGESWDFIY